MAANSASTGVNVNELIDLAGVRECLQFFTREKHWINETHLEFCRVPAPTFLEAERAAWFQEKFRSLGWDSTIDRAGNVWLIAAQLLSFLIYLFYVTRFYNRLAPLILHSHEAASQS